MSTPLWNLDTVSRSADRSTFWTSCLELGPMPNRASARTRDRVIDTVRALLAEGAFHESTVEKVAERAGVSRATLYTHFGSRTGLVDSICERLNATPSL